MDPKTTFNPESLKEFFNRSKRSVSAKTAWLFMLIILAIFGYLIYIWYFFVFNLSWGDENREEYMRQKDQEVILDSSRLEKILSESERKKESFPEEVVVGKDIFGLTEN